MLCRRSWPSTSPLIWPGRWSISGSAVDRLTPTRRSELMSRIRGKNTIPEIVVRRFLHAKGLRYRLHDKRLPGTPDLVFASRKIVVFVHGCFWHGHEGCRRAALPSTRTEFWADKISANVKRDLRAEEALKRTGWQVFILWQCEINMKTLGDLATNVSMRSHGKAD
ncbi:very short patch repair endonuclease [Mesorhizobium amorphae]